MKNKDEPVFARDIKRSTAFKKFDKAATSETGDDLYPHLTFFINSVSQYLNVIKIICPIEKKKTYDMDIIYRGMSDSKYKLIPSLARYECSEYNCGHTELEHYIVNEFLSLKPEAFLGLTSNFDILAKMQHYGLPTRLLDFTTNPLMALFFACESNSKRDGRVVCHKGEVNITANNIVDVICGSYSNIIDYNHYLDEFLSWNNISLYCYLRKLYRIIDFYPLLSRPKYWNERQQRQSSVFMVFPNELNDNLDKWLSWYNNNDERLTSELLQKLEVIKESENPSRIYPKKVKQEFEIMLKRKFKIKMTDLDFTVTHDTMRMIFDSYNKDDICTNNFELTEKGNIVFSNRFTFTSEIQPIDKNTLSTKFCSIIIRGNAKKRLLKELSLLGIDKSFVYPELEYTVEKIKAKYMSFIRE